LKQIRTVVFSWILLIGFLIPMSINFVHSFENHEHITCNAKDVKHFHQLENDCSNFHYIIHSFVYSISHYKQSFAKKIRTKTLLNVTSNYFGVDVSLKSSRAPPIL